MGEKGTIEYYSEWLGSIFDVESGDPLNYASALLRVGGIEGPNTDPLDEARRVTADLARLRQVHLEQLGFDEPGLTRWRLRLIAYAQMVEMNAPMQVLANLLRLRSGQRYAFAPFRNLERKRSKSKPFGIPQISISSKLDVLDKLATAAKRPPVSDIFGEFYFNDLRNSIQHADYALTDDGFYMRYGSIPEKESGNVLSPIVRYDRLEQIVSRAENFYEAFFRVDEDSRRGFAAFAGKAIPFDRTYKGLLEFLVDPNGLLCGWKVHWPNGEESHFQRTPDGCRAVNMYVGNDGVSLHVGIKYGANASSFSPLVAAGGTPLYTPCQGATDPPVWPDAA